MKFGIISEGMVNRGMSYGVRLREVLKELTFAEEMGFDFIGVSEQHFMEAQWSISAPEMIMAALAERTHTIKLRQMAVVSLGFNHPIRVAERIATLDILSRGRVELATARSNNAKTMAAFGLDPNKTKQEWREHIEVMIRALGQPEFEFHGEFYDFDPVALTPRLESKALPPLYVTATSPESHYATGKLGLGCMTADTYLGWDYQQMIIDEYKKGIAEAEPIGGLYEVNNNLTGFTFPAYCATSKDRAFEEARTVTLAMMDHVLELAEGLAGTKAPGYEYWGKLAENLRNRGDDLEYLNDSTPMLMIGDPDFFVERCRKLEEMGINEIVLKLDGYGHSRTMRAIELIGKYVIPEMNSNPGSIPANPQMRMGIPNVPKFEI